MVQLGSSILTWNCSVKSWGLEEADSAARDLLVLDEQEQALVERAVAEVAALRDRSVSAIP